MADSGGIPELIYNHPDGRLKTRLEMEQWLRESVPKVHWLRIIANRAFGLAKQVAWDMREIVLKHWLLDEMIKKGFITGEIFGINTNSSNDEAELRQFTQKLAVFIQNGFAVSPQHAEGVDMSGYTPPPPPMMGSVPNGQPGAYPPGPPQPPGPPGGYAAPPGPPGPPGGYAAPPGPPPQQNYAPPQPPGPPMQTQYAQPPQPPGPPMPQQGGYAPPPQPPGPPAPQQQYAQQPPPAGPPMSGPPMGPPPGVPQAAAPGPGRGRKKADAAAPQPPGPPGAAPNGAPPGFAPPAPNGFAPLPAPGQQSFPVPAPQQQAAPQVAPAGDPALGQKLDQLLSIVSAQQKELGSLRQQIATLNVLNTVLGRAMYQRPGSSDPAGFLQELQVPIPQ